VTCSRAEQWEEFMIYKNRNALLAAGFAVALATAFLAPPALADDSCTANAEAKIAALKGQVRGKDPNGVTPGSADSVKPTAEEIAKIKSLGLKAAIAMHETADGWAQAQLAGLKHQFDELGIKIVSSTDAQMNPADQVSQIETALALKPDILISLPTDPVATADIYRKATKQGVKVVFMDNVPKGFKPGTDYVAMVSDDRINAGVINGYQMAEAIGCKGKVGIVFHGVDFYVTHQSYLGVKEALAQFPDIQIVDEKGIVGPDFAGETQTAVSAMLTKTPDLVSVWTVWDLPGEGAMAAARAENRPDLKIVTLGLGQPAAVALAKQDLIVATAAVAPYAEATAEANLGALAAIGRTDLPAFVATEAMPTTAANVLDAWKYSYGVDAPQAVKDAAAK
jgi:ribose transport system substrate-binding protein